MLPPCLLRPLPIANLFLVNALRVRADRTQPRHTVDNIDGQIEAVNLVDNGQLERSIDVPLFLVPAHVNVVMIPAPVTQLMNQRSVRMEIEDDRLVGGKQGIEVPVGKAMRMFCFRNKTKKVNDVNKPYFEIGKALLQNRDR